MERIIFIAGQLNAEIQCREVTAAQCRTLVKDTRILLGGRAFRQALNSKSLGMNVILLGRVGNDHHGKMILESLTRAGISSRYIEEAETELTGLCLQVFDGDELKHEFFDPGANLGEIDYQIPIEYYLHLCDAIVVNKWCNLCLRRTILTTAREHSVPCIYVHSGPPDEEESTLPIDYLFLETADAEAIERDAFGRERYSVSRGVFLYSPGRLRLLSPSGEEVYHIDLSDDLEADGVVAKLAGNLLPETKLRETALFFAKSGSETAC